MGTDTKPKDPPFGRRVVFLCFVGMKPLRLLLRNGPIPRGILKGRRMSRSDFVELAERQFSTLQGRSLKSVSLELSCPTTRKR